MFRTKSRSFPVAHEVLRDQPQLSSLFHHPNLCALSTLAACCSFMRPSKCISRPWEVFVPFAWYALSHIIQVSVQMPHPQ